MSAPCRQYFHRILRLVAAVALAAGSSVIHGASDPSSHVTAVRLPSRSPLAPGEQLFRELPSSVTQVGFQMQLPDMVKHVQEFLHLSVLGGLCVGDVDGDGLADIYVTSPAGGNRLLRNLGGFRFADVTVATGLMDEAFWGTGAVMVDIDGDGDLDVYACGYRSPNRLWINNGGNGGGGLRFENRASQFGLDFDGASMSAAFADYDHDGDLDCYLATTAVPPNPEQKFRVRFEGNRPVIPDELKEHWALLYLPGDRAHQTEAGQYDHLYRNDGGRFVDVSKAAGIDGPYFTLGVVWWDANGDGWPDLYVANDYFGPDQFYLNQRDGTFKEVVREWIPHTPWSSMGMDIGDLNNDGRVDLITTDMLGRNHYRRNVMLGEVARLTWFLEFADPPQYSRNAVLINTGTGRMLEAAYQSGMAGTDWTWAPRIEDYDEDGRVDVFYANGMIRDIQHSDLANYADKVLGGGSAAWAEFWAGQEWERERNAAFRNLGDLKFEPVADRWGLDKLGVSFGVATADLDGDGDPDLIVSNADAPLSIYENRTSDSNRLVIRLQGRGGNKQGIGATVKIVADGLEQSRYLTTTRSWLGGSEPVLHFGLGASTNVSSAEIIWPDGKTQKLGNIAANQYLRITEPADLPSASLASDKPVLFSRSTILENIRDVASQFDDAALQPMLPQRLSRTRFSTAWGDVDADGDEDLFIGGGVGEPGRLYLQNPDGGFSLKPVSDFETAELCADGAAVFFDADGDQDLDLYVVSGGVEAPAGNSVLYQDRLYLNDGRGGFTVANGGVLPAESASGSCVAVADVNGDGRPDLFVGGGPVPGRYPEAERSYLLLNRNGSFVEATPDALQQPGLVTDAVWADVDGNGAPDLLIGVELGSLQLYLNDGKGALSPATMQSGLGDRTGWWRSVAAADLDQDGDIDLIAGNIGLNTKYSPPEHLPQLMYTGTFGTNDAVRFIEAYHEDGQIHSHRGFDELARAFRNLRDQFLNFDEFSSTNLAGVFSPSTLAAAARTELNTPESGIWLNDGSGRFTFRPLPPLAQLSPLNDIVVADVVGDGALDLVIAQNDHSPDPLAGRYDGGVSLLLRGDGRGAFVPVWPDRSGIVVPGEARSVDHVDVNGDGRPDLVFGAPGERMQTFIRR